LAEQIFFIDSEVVIRILEALMGDEGAKTRWLLSLYAIDTLLKQFALNLEGKRTLIKGMLKGFEHELGADIPLKRALGDKYRRERRRVENILNEANEELGLKPLTLHLRECYARYAPVVADLSSCEKAGQLEEPITRLLVHFIHMHANRIFASRQRLHEFVLYDFLDRFYESTQARRAKGDNE